MFAPATVTTNSVAHAQQKIHSRKMLNRVLKKFIFHTVGEKDSIEKQSGLTVQWFRYAVPGVNTVPTATGTDSTGQTTGNEGNPGSGSTASSSVVKATLSQYSDFMTFSDVAVDTLIDPVVSNGADNLGYRAGYSVDTIIRGVIDATSGSTELTLVGSEFSGRDIAKGVQTLQGNDVMPFENGQFKVILHPFVTYDLRTDPEAGGWLDLNKHVMAASEGTKREDRGKVGNIWGADVFESTNVFTEGSPVQYRAYLFGKGGLGIVDLSGRGPSYVSDPSRQRFKVRQIMNEGTIAEPEGLIRAAVSYNFLFTAVVLDTATYRFRVWDPVPTIAS